MRNAVKIGVVGLVVLAHLSAAVPVYAQNSRLLGTYKDWDARVTTNGDGSRECYMVSAVKKWSASKKNVRRGDTFILVSHRPKYKIKDQINVEVGYPLRQGSELQVRVDGKRRFDLFTEGRSAWAYDTKDDAAIVNAMKRGITLVATASSQRGTRTTDTYSLRGFTAAYNAITRACG